MAHIDGTGALQLWDDAVVRYENFDALPDPLPLEIRAAMNVLRAACPALVFLEKAPADTTFVRFLVTSGKNGAESVGCQLGKANNVNLNPGNPQWVLHELLHVLGFLHEHQRDDRDRRITVNTRTTANPRGCVDPNNPDMCIIQGTNKLSAYDIVSVMHYAYDMGNDFCGAGSTILQSKQDPNNPKAVGAKDYRALSATDAVALQALYGTLGITNTINNVDYGPTGGPLGSVDTYCNATQSIAPPGCYMNGIEIYFAPDGNQIYLLPRAASAADPDGTWMPEPTFQGGEPSWSYFPADGSSGIGDDGRYTMFVDTNLLQGPQGTFLTGVQFFHSGNRVALRACFAPPGPNRDFGNGTWVEPAFNGNYFTGEGGNLGELYVDTTPLMCTPAHGITAIGLTSFINRIALRILEAPV